MGKKEPTQIPGFPRGALFFSVVLEIKSSLAFVSNKHQISWREPLCSASNWLLLFPDGGSETHYGTPGTQRCHQPRKKAEAIAKRIEAVGDSPSSGRLALAFGEHFCERGRSCWRWTSGKYSSSPFGKAGLPSATCRQSTVSPRQSLWRRHRTRLPSGFVKVRTSSVLRKAALPSY